MKDLLESRKEIDEIDDSIIRLFEKRMEVCKNVAEYKLRTGKPVLDRQRELDKIATLKTKASDDFYAHGVEELFEQIMAMSRKMQYKLLNEEGVTIVMITHDAKVAHRAKRVVHIIDGELTEEKEEEKDE